MDDVQHHLTGRRWTAAVLTVMALGIAPGCSDLMDGPGENEDDVLTWACSNSIGWLLGDSSDRIHYAGTATEMMIHADQGESDGEDWDLALSTSESLVGWYDSGNEFAVRAFIDVNDCFDKGSGG